MRVDGRGSLHVQAVAAPMSVHEDQALVVRFKDHIATPGVAAKQFVGLVRARGVGDDRCAGHDARVGFLDVRDEVLVRGGGGGGGGGGSSGKRSTLTLWFASIEVWTRWLWMGGRGSLGTDIASVRGWCGGGSKLISR